MKALIVDDEIVARISLRNLLIDTRSFSEIFVFKTPLEVLTSLLKIDVDVAFLDIELEYMNGIDLAKRILEIKPDILIIFITSHQKYALSAFDVEALDYIIKPYDYTAIIRAMKRIKRCIQSSKEAQHSIFVQCLGDFQVYYNGNPIIFSSKKAKELFALLVDRKGAIISSVEAIELLWEGRKIDKRAQSLYRVVLSRLIRTFMNIGITDIVKRTYGGCYVDITKFKCDYYNLIKKDSPLLSNFYGEYMSQYSWAEDTHGTLVFGFDNYLKSLKHIYKTPE